MPSPKTPAPRGRPRSITPARIADAGIAIGLPHITFVGLAAALGVSHMALYKHVPSLEALKSLVAEQIFSRWELPPARAGGPGELEQYLFLFVASLRELVKAHPGLTPFLLRRSAATQPMIAKIDHHQSLVAQAYGISKTQARELLATLAFHCIAVADTVYSVSGQGLELASDRAAEAAEIEAEFAQGMRTLIVGALTLLAREGSANYRQ
ncbi:AcrR family transcriptional regulator [Paucibacter oligotrophus]|uniref:AcrR family transcriptional regulator n=1 Tax=Roseateles oligotrophus TaxID=1769250 RepID=A0A840LGJ1_9BURK|nr:TetR/AcrR family transcriptional regulator [Roseateles oligotrophus]MBB4845732.1 AcrR family transcriptional regulator [Roseateles oligotrophus]